MSAKSEAVSHCCWPEATNSLDRAVHSNYLVEFALKMTGLLKFFELSRFYCAWELLGSDHAMEYCFAPFSCHKVPLLSRLSRHVQFSPTIRAANQSFVLKNPQNVNCKLINLIKIYIFNAIIS